MSNFSRPKAARSRVSAGDQWLFEDPLLLVIQDEAKAVKTAKAKAIKAIKEDREKRLEAGKCLQRKMRIKVRAKPRKIAFKRRASVEVTGNEHHWSADANHLHTAVLEDALRTVKECCEKRSAMAAEVMAWVNRPNRGQAFSFEECCRRFNGTDEDGAPIGAQDPEVLAAQLRLLIERTFGTALPHAALLRQGILDAEAGDADATTWILSDSDEPLSFTSCCVALGFDPASARDDIHLAADTDSKETAAQAA